MFREQQLSVGEATLQFAVGPKNGPPVVLLHGVCRRWQDYGGVLPTLGSRWQAFALDQRGHGASSRAERYLVTDYIGDAIAFVAGLEQPAVLIGHSLGALVALGVAAAVPERVRGVVLEDPPSSGFLARIDETSYATQFRGMQSLAGSGKSTSQIARELADVKLPDGSRVGDRRDAVSLRFLAKGLAQLDPAVLAPVLERRWLTDVDPLALAAQTACPALLLSADVAQGGMLPHGDANALAAALADVCHIHLPEIGHLIHGVERELYLRYVVGFLDSLE